jgi:hypothetical protein
MENKKIVTILLLFILSVNTLKAQCPYIIVDKDGYTNVREQPNSKSKIIGKIYKYQIFFSIDDFCGSGMFSTDTWEAILSDKNPDGYIYKKNILSIYKLPYIVGKGIFELTQENKESIIIAKNDSVKIIMKLQPFNKLNHKGWVYGGNSDVLEEKLINNEIKEIEIIYRDTKTIFPPQRINEYCDVSFVRVYIGYEGELYLYFGGGGDAGNYAVWFSIVNGIIHYETMAISC